MYVMVHMVLICLIELQGTQIKREIQNEKVLPTIGFETGTFRLRSRRDTICITITGIHNQTEGVPKTIRSD